MCSLGSTSGLMMVANQGLKAVLTCDLASLYVDEVLNYSPRLATVPSIKSLVNPRVHIRPCLQ